MTRCRKFVVTLAGALWASCAQASTGLAFEGYGAEPLAMGGAAMAYDTGSAAAMSNPATLGLGPEDHRIDLALDFFTLRAASDAGTEQADSASPIYKYPAFGWSSRKGQLAYGAGVYTQGGVATRYSGRSWLAHDSGLVNSSQITAGRFVIPVAYELTPRRLYLGGSFDLVWTAVDWQMLLWGPAFHDMLPNSLQAGASGRQGSMRGGVMDALAVLRQAGEVADLNYAYFDFDDGSGFTGAAAGVGIAAKAGFVLRVTPELSVGAAVHSPTRLQNLRAEAASLTVNTDVDSGVLAGTNPSGSYSASSLPLRGTLTLRDFQWPALAAMGAAYRLASGPRLALDIKRIFWSEVMDHLDVRFLAEDTAANGWFQGQDLHWRLRQRWRDQNVIALGGGFPLASQLELRAGFSYASNPVPRDYLTPLLPMFARQHYSVGAGYFFRPYAAVELALSVTPRTGYGGGSALAGGDNSVQQLSWQLQYRYRYQ